ncbi:MAG: N-acetylmuramic acid 6-phosphate etherase [Acidobacteria bacterium]|nr:N-acetylmuramic acid 6-phosphate etherase [Acidobacteriota bacterium]
MNTTEELNPRTAGIDRLSTLEALHVINREDQQVALAVEKVLPAVARAVEAIAARLAAGGRLIYAGTGTSGRLGILDASECPPTFGVSPELVQGIIAGGYEACYRSVEASEDDREAGARDLRERGLTGQDVVVGIAASGRTPYTIGAVTYAREIGALTVAVTCNEGTELARAVEIAIEPVVGPEVIAGSTRLKSGTAQKLVLNMISTMTMVRLGYVTGNRMTNMQPRNSKLRWRAVGIVTAECGMAEGEAERLLERAGWDLRVAIVMWKAGVEPEAAQAALEATNFAVAPAIEKIVTGGNSVPGEGSRN